MEGETIVCLAGRMWDSLWRSTQQYMSRFAVQNRVFYFEPGRNPDRRFSTEFVRNLPSLIALRARRLGENLTIVETPSTVPHARRHLPQPVLRLSMPLAARINQQALLLTVKRAMAAYGIRSPILWLYSPLHMGLPGKLGEKLVCYFVYDELADFAANASVRELLQQYDGRMTRAADVVLASSRAQFERRKRLNPNTWFVPNACDFALFHTALDQETPVPPAIAGLKKPILGYVGCLGPHVDVELLVRVAAAFPDCTLLLVGPDALQDGAHYRRLCAMDNVHFTGRQDVSALPGYLKAVDVALMPYVLAGHVLSAYPLKLHEYLAAGRASVAMALPELGAFAHVVRLAQTHDEFIQRIRKALCDRSPEAIAARVAVARENTWDNRVQDIYRVLAAHLAAREERVAR